jgi:hypothetical protein
LTAVTPFVATSQQNLVLTDAAGALAATAGARVRMTSGAAAGATGWIISATATTMEIAGNLQVLATPAATGVAATAGVGDSYVVETLPRVPTVALDCQGAASVSTGANAFTALVLRDLDIWDGGSDSRLVNVVASAGARQARMQRCRFRGDTLQLGMAGLVGILQGTLLHGLSTTQIMPIQVATLNGGGLLTGGVILSVRSTGVTVSAHWVARGNGALGAVRAQGPVSVIAGASLGSFGNPTGPGVVINDGGMLQCGTTAMIRGDGNSTFGLVIPSGRVVTYGTTKPVITGGTADTQIGGANVAYAAVPLFDTAKACGLVTL